MTLRTRISGLVLAVCLVLVASPGSVHAQVLPDLPKAQKLSPKEMKKVEGIYAKADKYYRRGRLLKAHEAAQKAFNKLPGWATALSLAKILTAMNQSCNGFRHALLATDMAKDAKQRALAAAELLAASTNATNPCQLGAVRVSGQADAEVAVGKVRFNPPRTVGLAPGEHALKVSAPGKRTKELKVKIALGMLLVETFQLRDIDKSVVCTPPLIRVGEDCVEPPVERQCPDGTELRDGECVTVGAPWEPSPGPWVLIGVGAAAVVTGGVMIGLSAAEVSGLDDYVNPRPDLSETERERLYNEGRDKAELFYNTGFIVGGVGLAAVLAGIIWKVLDQPPDDNDGRSVNVGELPAVELTPWNGPKRGGVMLRGTF